MDQRYWHLRSSQLFERLNSEQITRLERTSRSKSFAKGELVYLPSDEADCVILTVSGRIKLYTITSDGKQAVLAFIDPGEVFGELPVVTGGQRDEYAEAMERTTLVIVPGSEIRHLMGNHPDFMFGITKLIGLRRQRFERRLKSLLFRSNRERLAHLLVELAQQYGLRNGHSEIELSLKLSHQELANVIGSTRESVTLLLGDLQVENLIAIRRRRIVIRDLPALAAEVDQPVPTIANGTRTEGTASLTNRPKSGTTK
ncbi:Crp/Fnr family transcriptional regulator [Stratiformator vulcanicus]|uniref:Global nitrogen regulator n=1 Tax=Stratiformator vulcanicus TaxID=2527980 RepID=A0A517QW00_9PLAN|nr:Crp/Fnr family transcriptional regulator [Stratiformator vulcanicus]QDT35842.1 Global nitrogen regulator [Stratiformator vulcanicus]